MLVFIYWFRGIALGLLLTIFPIGKKPVSFAFAIVYSPESA